MGQDISKLPPQVQERLLRLQQLQQTLQSVLTQKQRVEIELTEVEQALTELQRVNNDAAIFKTIGPILVKSEKTTTITELNERKELLNVRVKVLGKQEERLRKQLKDVQLKLQQDLSPI